MNDINIATFRPITINNFLSNDNISTIKNIVENKDIYKSFIINSSMGCLTYGQNKSEQNSFNEIKQDLKNKIEKNIKMNIDTLDLVWHRYSPKTGLNPIVGIHKDSSHDYHVLSFTVPIDNSFIWDFFISGKKYSLNNNEAVMFCVTEDFHWRPERLFLENETYDVLIGRFSIVGSRQKIIERKDESEIKRQYYKMLKYSK